MPTNPHEVMCSSTMCRIKRHVSRVLKPCVARLKEQVNIFIRTCEGSLREVNGGQMSKPETKCYYLVS